MEHTLRLLHVSKTYRMGEVDVPVLRGVDLDIADRDLLVIVGPSGSGKSTLLNIMGGIDRPTDGEVLFRGRSLTGMSESELTLYRRHEVGFVFQFYNLVPTLTALENVLVSTEISEDPIDAAEALDMVGLTPRREHFPAQLSGGEQQRVAIARAIAKNPALLLCDEPTGSLDVRTGREVLGLLDRLNRELGKTVVIITHNAAIAQMAERTVRISGGRTEEGPRNAEPVPIERIAW